MRTLGLRVKSGVAIVAAIDGEPHSWRIVHCASVPLSADTGQYARFPYHPLIEMDAGSGTAASRAAVAAVRAASRKHLGALLGSLDFAAAAGVIGGRGTDPKSITNPHIRVHAMEGRLFQAVVIAALERAGIAFHAIHDRQAQPELARVLQTSGKKAWELISLSGRGVIKPWRADEKLAVAGALYALCLARRGHP